MKKILFILCSIILLNSCTRDRECEVWDVPFPPSLTLQITYDDGLYYSDSVLKLVRVKYAMDGLWQVESLTTNFTGPLASVGLVSENKNFEISKASARNGVRYFYFHFPDGSVDTMYLDIEYVDDLCRAKLEDCYCRYPVRKLIYNGNEAEIHEFTELYSTRQIFKVVR